MGERWRKRRERGEKRKCFPVLIFEIDEAHSFFPTEGSSPLVLFLASFFLPPTRFYPFEKRPCPPLQKRAR